MHKARARSGFSCCDKQLDAIIIPLKFATRLLHLRKIYRHQTATNDRLLARASTTASHCSYRRDLTTSQHHHPSHIVFRNRSPPSLERDPSISSSPTAWPTQARDRPRVSALETRSLSLLRTATGGHRSGIWRRGGNSSNEETRSARKQKVRLLQNTNFTFQDKRTLVGFSARPMAGARVSFALPFLFACVHMLIPPRS